MQFPGALPCLALPCLALPCLTLLCFALLDDMLHMETTWPEGCDTYYTIVLINKGVWLSV